MPSPRYWTSSNCRAGNNQEFTAAAADHTADPANCITTLSACNSELGCGMTDHELLQTLQAFETELHREATRRNASRMEALLHPDFRELGRSGRSYSRKDILARCASEDFDHPPIASYSFALTRLSRERALLTYISEHLDQPGRPYRYTLRSSLWVLTKEIWQMRFHRATLTHGFSKTASEQSAADGCAVKPSLGTEIVEFGLWHGRDRRR